MSLPPSASSLAFYCLLESSANLIIPSAPTLHITHTDLPSAYVPSVPWPGSPGSAAALTHSLTLSLQTPLQSPPPPLLPVFQPFLIQSLCSPSTSLSPSPPSHPSIFSLSLTSPYLLPVSLRCRRRRSLQLSSLFHNINSKTQLQWSLYHLVEHPQRKSQPICCRTAATRAQHLYPLPPDHRLELFTCIACY